MNWVKICRNLKNTAALLLCALMITAAGCGRQAEQMQVSADVNAGQMPLTQDTPGNMATATDDDEKGNTAMKLFINGSEVPVIWENNEAVAELSRDAGKNEIKVAMSMYSNNEQVGSLGKKYPAADSSITARNGDIMLYNSSNIVLFYGSNSWAYTRLGRLDLTEAEVTKLLSEGNVTLTLSH